MRFPWIAESLHEPRITTKSESGLELKEIAPHEPRGKECASDFAREPHNKDERGQELGKPLRLYALRLRRRH